MEVQLEEVFSMWSVPRSYLEDTWGELPVVSFKRSCQQAADQERSTSAARQEGQQDQ
jgi:hypothetical protein